MELGTVASLLGAVGLGSVATKYLDATVERRKLRASALSALARVESERWVDDSERVEFVAAARDLEIACMLARIPRAATDEYLVYARAAYWRSMSGVQNQPDSDFAGAIDGHLADLTKAAARYLRDLIYAGSLRRRLLARRMLRRLKQHPVQAELEAASASDIARSRKYT